MEDFYILNSSKYHSSTLAQLRNDKAHSDVTLVVGGKNYEAHKLILGAASPVFRQMFNRKWKESTIKKVVLHESTECQDVFDKFLDFIYGCKGEKLTIATDMMVNEIEPLLILAEKYQCDSLKTQLTNFLITSIGEDLHHCIEWLSIAERMQISDLVNRCFELICWNLKYVSSPAFQSHTSAARGTWASLSSKQLTTISKRRDIIIETEFDLFVALEIWYRSRVQGQEEKGRKNVCLEDIHALKEFGNMTKVQLQHCKASVFKAMPSLSQAVDNALAAQLFDAEFCLASTRKRIYLNTSGTKDIGFSKTSTVHTNSAVLNSVRGSDVLNDENGRPLRLDFTFHYEHSKEQLIFKIVGFRREEYSHRYGGCMDRSVSNSVKKGSQLRRVVATFLIKHKTTGIIRYLLQYNNVRKYDGIDGRIRGVTIAEFPGITCVDIGQFHGDYLGQFEILYKICISNSQ